MIKMSHDSWDGERWVTRVSEVEGRNLRAEAEAKAAYWASLQDDELEEAFEFERLLKTPAP